jgi:flagellar motor switch protein FliM
MTQQDQHRTSEHDLDRAVAAAESLAGPVDPGLGVDIASVLAADPDDVLPATGPAPYDFHRPHTVSRAFQQNLQSVADTFAKSGTIEFTSLLRMNAEIAFHGLRQCSYGEYLAGLPRSTCAASLTMEPLKGALLLQFDLALCFAFMKKLLGGTPEPESRLRDFTEIERAIAGDLTGRFVEVLRRAVSKLVEARAAKTGLENNPNYLSGIGQGESVIVLDFRVGLGAAHGPLSLVFPLAAFGPVRDIFDPTEAREERDPAELQEDREKVMDTLQDMSSELVVELARRRVRLEEIVGLSVGDVLDLGRRVDEPLKVCIQGREAWRGQPGRIGDRHAVRLVSPWTKE